MSNLGVLVPFSTACASVLMPCRNAGPYLQAAVQSVLAQKECLELLVADGGSISSCSFGSIVEADPRLRIVSRSDEAR